MTQLIDLGKIRFYFAGQWDDAATYELNDVVKYGGNVYVYTYTVASQGHVPTDINYWALMIEGLNFTGVFSSVTEYQVGDGVAHGGKVYISIKTGSGHTPPNTEYWSQFADGIQYEGEYSNSANYQKNDVVTYGGSVYIAKQDTSGNLPTAQMYWDKFVEGVDATGVWNASTSYVPNQLAAYGAKIYLSLTNNTNKTPSTNPTDWSPFIDGLRAMGQYDAETQYHANDIVTYGSTVYIASTDTIGHAPTDSNYWDTLTSGTTLRGEWLTATEYLPGDVIIWGGNTYITDQFHSSGISFNGDKIAGKWTKYNSGVRYRGAWDEATFYVEGDIVSDGENARIAIVDHTSAAFLIDDEDKWDILAKGATGLLPAQGGRAGYVLTTDGAIASFERDVTNLYFGDGARAFIEGDAALTDVATAAAWDSESFAQNVVINNLDLSTGDGSEQSADFIAYTTGSTNSAGWADLGFTGPDFSSATYGITGPGDGYVFTEGFEATSFTVTNVALASHTATITTGESNTFEAGRKVRLSNCGDTFNGAHVIVSVVDSTTFTVEIEKADVASTAVTGTGTYHLGNGNLVLATGNHGAYNKIVFAAGGFVSGSTQMSITPNENVHIEIATASTSATTGALTVVGGVGITGDQYIAGDLTVIGNVDLQGVTKLPVGAGATQYEIDAELSDAVVIAAGNSAGFVQNALVNLGSGISSSADYIAYAAEGNNVSGWVDMGITNASFNDPTYGVTGPHDGYIFMSAPSGTTGKGNLVIATDNTGTENKIVLAAGGLGTGNEQMVITPNQNVHIEIATPSTNAQTGALTVVGGVGISGQISFDGLMRTEGQLYFGEGAEAFEAAADLTNARAVFIVQGDPYAQVSIQNPTSTSSGDIIVYADNGDDLSGWIDMGVTGSAFSQSEFGITGANDGYIFYQAPENTSGAGNLVIATGDGGTQNKIILAAGGFASGKNQMTITPDTNIHIEIDTPSVSPITGALTVVGGVGILGDMNIAGDVNISGQISFAGGGTTVETENLAVTDPMVFVANGQLTGDFQDFAFLGQSRSIREGIVLGPYGLTQKTVYNNVATLITGTTPHGYDVGDTVVVTDVDTLITYKTAFTVVRKRANESVTTDYVKNIALVARTSNVATITTDGAHGYSEGETVVIAGADTGYNGSYSITSVPSTTTFTIANTGLDDTANASVGTTTVSRTVSNDYVTLTTSTPHNFQVGESVVVSGISSFWNGTFTITSVPSPTTFKYIQSGSAQTPTNANGGIAYVAVPADPIFNGTHTITAIPNTKSFSFAKTTPNLTLQGTTKENINYVTAWAITNGVATLTLTNPPTENVGSFTAVQNVDASIDDTVTVTAVNTSSAPYTLSFAVELDDVLATTLTTSNTKTVTSRNRNNNVATITTSTDHEFIVGQQVVVSGVSASFNGTYIIDSIPAANKFTYAQIAANVTETASTGTAVVAIPNPGTTTLTLPNQGTATVTDPSRGSYTGLARDHSTGHWWIFSGVEQKPTLTIDFTSVDTNDLHIRDLWTTGGDIYSSATTFNMVDEVVTTLNLARAATTINMGANLGTLTIGNPTVVGTQATQNLWNTVATTINLGNAATTVNEWNAVTTLNLGNTATAAQTVNMFGGSTGSSTYNFAFGATVSGSTKTINIGTNGVANSTTNINIGSQTAGASTGTIRLDANTVLVAQDPTPAQDLSVATKRYVDQRPQIITGSTTLVQRGTSRTSGLTSTGNYFVVPASGMTLTLPASPALGDEIVITDIASTAFNTPFTVARNGQLIQGLNEDLIFNVNAQTVRLVYSNATYGWRMMA
jgi:hypothetical protein